MQLVSYVGNFNFNWMTNYIYSDAAAPAFPKGTLIHVTAWYDKHARQSQQSRSGAMGRLRGPHRGRNGARLDERDLYQRRRIQCLGSPAQAEAAGGQRQPCALARKGPVAALDVRE